MPKRGKIEIEKIKASLFTFCTNCGHKITPAKLQRVERFVQGVSAHHGLQTAINLPMSGGNRNTQAEKNSDELQCAIHSGSFCPGSSPVASDPQFSWTRRPKRSLDVELNGF